MATGQPQPSAPDLGDDDLANPFALSELVARVEALGRRGVTQAPAVSTVLLADLEIDIGARIVRRAGNAGRVVTRSMLLEHVWDYHFDPQTNVIDQHPGGRRARDSIERPGGSHDAGLGDENASRRAG